MSDKASSCTSIRSAGNPGKKEMASRDLRLEILELRKRLARAEDVAARHAVMLREGDHRIKNSLQIVASLISEQARREVSDTAREGLLSAATRIRSISAIHDALQGAGGADIVDLGSVLTTMCESLQAMAGSEGLVEVRVQAESIMLSGGLAQPLVLAVNELVVNALRHAFPDQDRGLVYVRVAQIEDEVSITVADDGVGLPDDYDADHGYGTKLVGMMVRQACAVLVVDRATGASFTIRLPNQRPSATKA